MSGITWNPLEKATFSDKVSIKEAIDGSNGRGFVKAIGVGYVPGDAIYLVMFGRQLLRSRMAVKDPERLAGALEQMAAALRAAKLIKDGEAKQQARQAVTGAVGTPAE